ncbi:g11418 [Coccomyxa elongata]
MDCLTASPVKSELEPSRCGVVPTRLRHYTILGGIYADTPAQRKLSKWLGHSAYLGCDHCLLLGTVGPNDHGMYFQGYTEMRAAGNAALRARHAWKWDSRRPAGRSSQALRKAADQEKVRGQSALELELWVENTVQYAKGTTKFRTTSNPEILLANQVLLAEAIKKAPTVHPDLRDYNEVVYGNIGGAPDRGNQLDQPYAEDNTGFMGSGARPKRELLPHLTALAERHIHDFPQAGWAAAACDTATYTVYKAVDIKGVEVVQSRAYLMARSRVSYFVRVDYEEEGTYVARISKYLKVTRADAEAKPGDVLTSGATCDAPTASERHVSQPARPPPAPPWPTPSAADGIPPELFWPDSKHDRYLFGNLYSGPVTVNCTVSKISTTACMQSEMNSLSVPPKPVRDHAYDCVWDRYNSFTYMDNGCAVTALPTAARAIYDEANSAFGENLLVFKGDEGRELYNTTGIKGLPAKFAMDFLVGSACAFSMVHQDSPLRLSSVICVTHGMEVVIMAPEI